MSVPVGIPVTEAESVSNVEPALLALQAEHGYPLGLTNALRESLGTNPLRFWICDNSYSMSENDGAVLVPTGAGYCMITSTRTEELTQTITEHATLSSALSARTDFHFLNPSHSM